MGKERKRRREGEPTGRRVERMGVKLAYLGQCFTNHSFTVARKQYRHEPEQRKGKKNAKEEEG